jgi:hypothetical protein
MSQFRNQSNSYQSNSYSRSSYGRSGSNNRGVEKKFCKVCHDAGKSEADYTSHYVRSVPGPNGIVTCPTLLNTECRYCYGLGHTAKFCPTLAQRNKPTAQRSEYQAKPKPKPVVERFGGFAALKADSDSDSEPVKAPNKAQIKEEFPALPISNNKSFASAAAVKKAPDVKEPEQLPAGWSVLKPVETKMPSSIRPDQPISFAPSTRAKTSTPWHLHEDSDSEDEDW